MTFLPNEEQNYISNEHIFEAKLKEIVKENIPWAISLIKSRILDKKNFFFRI